MDRFFRKLKKVRKELIEEGKIYHKKVFIINGSGGVGKDTFVNKVGEFVPTVNYSSVKKIKEIATMGGWNGGKTDKDRKFLSDLKFLFSQYNDLPFEDMKAIYRKFKSINSKDKCLFFHIREPEEVERAKKEFEAQTILVINSNIEEIKTNEADANVAKYNYDITIDNSGTLEDLEKIAKSFIKKYVFECQATDIDCLSCLWGEEDDEGLYCHVQEV